MKLIELKIKRLELAHEVKLNRREQRRALERARSARRTNYDPNPHMNQYLLLREHQMKIVSVQARAAGLAAAYLRGLPFVLVETPPKRRPKIVSRALIDAVLLNLLNFGRLPGYPDARFRDVEDWITGELTHIQLHEQAERDAAGKLLDGAEGAMALDAPDPHRELAS